MAVNPPIPSLAVSIFRHLGDGPNRLELSWEDLCKELSTVESAGPGPCPGHSSCPTKKSGALWSPTAFIEGKPRTNRNALTVACLVVDLDSPTPEAMGQLAARLDSLGLAYHCHATHTAGSWHLVIPFAVPIPAQSYPLVRQGALALLGAPADPNTKDTARFYYLPAVHQGDTHFETFEQEGRPLTPEECLDARPGDVEVARAMAESKTKSENFSEEFFGKFSGAPIDIAGIKTDLRRVRAREAVPVAKKLIAGEALALTGERDATINRAASVLATAPKEPIDLEAAMAVMEPCIRAMGEHLAPEGLEHWLEKARGSFERALERRIENDRKAEEIRQRMLKLLGRDEATKNARAAGYEEGDDSWRANLICTVDQQGNPAGIKPVGANVNLILTNDPGWRGALAFNLITKDIEILSGPFKDVPRASLETEVANWLAMSDYRLAMKSYEVGEQILSVARKNPIDPLKEYLEGLKWDGKTRVRKFFDRYFKARGDLVHLEVISKKWLVSCVARALQPGCKVDTVLILQGLQNAGKSAAMRILGGKFFNDSPVNPTDKDSRAALSRFWLLELAELTTLRKNDVETLKSFFSAQEDYIRPPYGRVAEIFPRRCIYVGTTNADEMLVDITGNRRYWPVEVVEIDLPGLEADRDQLWAEAVALYKAGEKWWLTKDEAEMAERVASAYVKVSHYEEPILKWLLGIKPSARPLTVTVGQVASQALGMTVERMQHGAFVEIGFALKRLNFRKQRVRVAGTLQWIHHTPEELLKAVSLGKGGVVLSAVEEPRNSEAGSESK